MCSYYYFPPIKGKVRDFHTSNIAPKRVGIIPYTSVDGVIYFGLAVDNASNELTDFGGQINRSDNDAIEGAIREFQEESLGIFGKLDPSSLLDSPIIYDTKNLIIFWFTDGKREEILDAFKKKKEEVTSYIEVIDIEWLSYEEFILEIREGSRLYKRVQNFLRRANNFYYLF